MLPYQCCEWECKLGRTAAVCESFLVAGVEQVLEKGTRRYDLGASP